MISKTSLIDRLTDNAMMEGLFSGRGRGSKREKSRPLTGRNLPGKVIEKLSEEERKVLRECTSKDFTWRGFN